MPNVKAEWENPVEEKRGREGAGEEKVFLAPAVSTYCISAEHSVNVNINMMTTLPVPHGLWHNETTKTFV